MHTTEPFWREPECTPQEPESECTPRTVEPNPDALEWTSQSETPSAPDPTVKPTKDTYDPLQLAFERFNRDLFDSTLPNALITLQRRRRSYGYFSGARFFSEDGKAADEIALNPVHFRDRPPEEVLATLVHEMVHLWQHHHGKPGRGRYHNREWAAKMKEVGLQPTDTGEEGGKETGERLHHLIVPDGPFDRSARKLLARSFSIQWTEKPEPPAAGGAEGSGESEVEESKSGKRVKYSCPECDLNAWAKHEARLMCADHQRVMEPAD